MKLCNRYNIPQETIDAMVKDGVIGCNWPRYEEVYNLYLDLKGSGKTQGQLYIEIGERLKMSEETVKKIILKMGKI